jgi:rhodanese-related sulfurtransferase
MDTVAAAITFLPDPVAPGASASARGRAARLLRVGTAWLCAAGCGFAAAQAVRPGSELPAALEGVQPVGSCRRDEPAPPGAARAASAPAAAATAQPDLSCAISVAELAAAQAQRTHTIVDLRSRDDHEQARIDGAMHASLDELRTLDVLRRKPLVLVGSGKAERELYAACARLRAQGFAQVKVLRGGFAQWLLEGRGVLARGEVPARSLRLGTAELWAESRFDANLVVVAPGQARLREQLQLAMPLADLQPATLKALLERRRRELRDAPLAAVVLVAEPGVSEEALLGLRTAIAPVPLLAYAQPYEQYAREMGQQQALWAGHARGPRQPPCGR